MVESTHTAGFWPSLYEPLRAAGRKVADWYAPASDASGVKDGYVINIELPGVKPEEIEVSVHGETLIVKGEKRAEREETKEEGGRTWFFSERTYGAFQRSFRLPPDADPEKIGATAKDGVLTLTVAKAAPAAPAQRKIEIRSL